MYSFTDYTTLTLNNTFLKGKEILDFCKRSEQPYFHSIGKFVEEWFNPNPTIQIQTSGSTGKPKIISVKKNRMLYSASLTAQFFDFQSGQNALLCLPVNYIAAKMMVIRAMFSGLNLICINPTQNPLENLPSNLTIDFAPMIPLQYQAIENNPSISQIKKILLGGSALNEDVEKRASLSKVQLFHGYGMTETLSHIALRKINGDNATLYYTAFPEIKLDVDNRNCLTIESPKLLDEKIITNDVVELINSHQFFWKGRFDYVINSGGIKLHPEIIEKKLHPLINKPFFVTGIKDNHFGEKLVLLIEGKSLANQSIAALKTSMEEVLDKYEMPKKIFFIEKFIVTESGKINRPQTKALALKD